MTSPEEVMGTSAIANIVPAKSGRPTQEQSVVKKSLFTYIGHNEVGDQKLKRQTSFSKEKEVENEQNYMHTLEVGQTSEGFCHA